MDMFFVFAVCPPMAARAQHVSVGVDRAHAELSGARGQREGTRAREWRSAAAQRERGRGSD